ncbi:molecular chaperone DnaJ [Stomatohabitans albus]|uniref:molecular chaperone DnaJ n=1 Tax=Stomatohabitans albus TaxID=3110766 RepID=UPI00300D0116
MAQADWVEKDFYKDLGVSASATEEDIRKAYRKLARKYHPDTSTESDADERFKTISAAYDVLSNKDSRAEYDQIRRMASSPFSAGARRTGGMGTGFSRRGQAVNFDIDDLLSSIMGDAHIGGTSTGRASTRTSTATNAPRKGGDVETNVNLNFEDALAGVTVTLRLSGSATCSACKGSGAQPGTSPETCPECNGASVITDNQGMFGFSSTCRTCMGRGTIIKEPCTRCAGSGVENRPRTLKARLPRGVKDGQVVRLKGKGEPGRNGGPAGDLFVNVHVSEHPVWSRDGNNLTMTLPISFAEANLGGNVAVPTPDGDVTVKISPGTASGKVLRIRNRGVYNGSGDERGDMLVTVQLTVPQNLSKTQKKLIEDFAQTDKSDPRASLRRAVERNRTTQGGDGK